MDFQSHLAPTAQHDLKAAAAASNKGRKPTIRNGSSKSHTHPRGSSNTSRWPPSDAQQQPWLTCIFPNCKFSSRELPKGAIDARACAIGSLIHPPYDSPSNWVRIFLAARTMAAQFFLSILPTQPPISRHHIRLLDSSFSRRCALGFNHPCVPSTWQLERARLFIDTRPFHSAPHPLTSLYRLSFASLTTFCTIISGVCLSWGHIGILSRHGLALISMGSGYRHSIMGLDYLG